MKLTYIGEKNLKYFKPFILETLLPGQAALGLIMDGRAVGAAVFSTENNICVIHSIYVSDGCRNQGCGSYLLKESIHAFQENGMTDFLCFYDGQEDITHLLEKNGFTCVQTSGVYHISIKDLCKNKRCIKIAKSSVSNKNTYSLDCVGTAQLKAFQAYAQKQGFLESLFEKENYDQNISFASIVDEKISSILLAKRRDDDIYVPMVLSKGEQVMSMLVMFSAFFHKVSEMNAKGYVIFLARNQKIADALYKLLGDEMKEEGFAYSALLKGEKDVYSVEKEGSGFI